MDLSGEVAKIHMRIDAKNLVATARTSHLPEQKETIHMISMLRKGACSGSIRDLAHISTQNCLADCQTKASAKADKLVTAAKTGKLSEVDIYPNFRTLMKHKAFLSTWCKTFMHTTEKDVFFLNTLKVSLAPTPQEGPFHVMFVRKQHTQEPKEPRDYDWNSLSCTVTAEPTLEPSNDLESQKKTLEKWSECNENKVCSRRHKHSVLQTSDVKFCRDSVRVRVSCNHFSRSMFWWFLQGMMALVHLL